MSQPCSQMLRLVPRYARSILAVSRVLGSRDFSYSPVVRRPQIIHSSHRNFSKVKDNAVTEVFFGEVFEHGFEGDDKLHDLRLYLYPDSEDKYIQILSQANSIPEVLACIEGIDELQSCHLTQALATIHHLQKLIICIRNSDYLFQIIKFNDRIMKNERFQKILELLEADLEKMTFLENSFSLMVLRKLSLPLTDPLMQKLYIRLVSNAKHLDLETLSYLTVALRPRILNHSECNEDGWKFGLLRIIPTLSDHLDNCTTAMDFKRIAICFLGMAFLISNKMMDRLANKFKSLVEAGMYKDVQNVETLSKLLGLVIHKIDWHRENKAYLRLLLDQHTGKVANLWPIHVTLLSKVLKITGEPVQLYQEVYERLCELLTTMDTVTKGGVNGIIIMANILEQKNHALPINQIEDILREHLESGLDGHLDSIFRIIKAAGISDKAIIDEFFNSSLALVEDEKNEVRNLGAKLQSISNIHNGFYRNSELENRIKEILEINIKQSYTCRDFAAHLGALLCLQGRIPQEVMDRFFLLLPQFNTRALMVIAHGIGTRLFFQKRGRQALKNRDQQDDDYLALDEISLGVSKAVNNILVDPYQNLSIFKLCSLLRSFSEVQRNLSFNESLYSLISERILEAISKMQVSHIVIQHVTFSLGIHHMLLELPKLTDKLFEFYVNNATTEEIHVRGLRRLLTLSYKCNHKPPLSFLETYAKMFYRDLESLEGLHVVELARILAAFNSLPLYLAQEIFSSEFMDRLDTEINMAGQNKYYISQLRNNLMQLNRCLVVQYPSYGVPWFHEAYCKESLAASSPPTTNQLRTEVYDELCSALGGWRFVQANTESQYYNPVHFEVQCDPAGTPLDLHTDTGVQPAVRIAVQVYRELAYTLDTKRLLGDHVLNNLQLTLQGWKVLTVNPFSWNSMYLSDSAARKQFLLRTIQALAASASETNQLTSAAEFTLS